MYLADLLQFQCQQAFCQLRFKRGKPVNFNDFYRDVIRVYTFWKIFQNLGVDPGNGSLIEALGWYDLCLCSSAYA